MFLKYYYYYFENISNERRYKKCYSFISEISHQIFHNLAREMALQCEHIKLSLLIA